MTQDMADPSSPPPDRSLPPDDPLARAQEAFRARRLGEAEGICRDLVSRDPNNIGALGIWAAVVARQGRVEQAIALFERALSIAPANGMILGNLSELYRLVYRLDDALAAARRAITLTPSSAANFVRLAKILVDRGEPDDALRHYLAALAVDPADANAHLGMGQILLARGDFRPGWFEYEWRNKIEQARGMIPRMKAPQWNGMIVPKGRILLIGDQGFGDVLHFARYIPAVAERCGEVILACSANLQPLLERIPGISQCFHRWQDSPGFTAYSLLSSLPYVFGTELHTVPASIPYLTPDPQKIANWRMRLGEHCQGGEFKVGLFWAGRAAHPNNRRRSMRLAQLAPLCDIPRVRFVSLQKDVPRQDIPTAKEFKALVDLSKEFADFDDTAAVISNLDLVITVDSAVAHLAGALGVPIWMMTARPSDWRWLLDRSDSPWYPTLRLFRQPRPGAWDEVVAAMRHELEELCASTPPMEEQRRLASSPAD
jgi:Tetratricopeptide repeat/Glycosyltransferase family 9 (heptosyltransferase)